MLRPEGVLDFRLEAERLLLRMLGRGLRGREVKVEKLELVRRVTERAEQERHAQRVGVVLNERRGRKCSWRTSHVLLTPTSVRLAGCKR